MVDAPRINAPPFVPVNADLIAAIEAGNEATDAYNAVTVQGIRDARDDLDVAVDEHNAATDALEAECERRLAQWLAG